MDPETIKLLAIISAWLLTTGISAGVAAYKWFKAKNYKAAIDTIVGAVQTLPTGVPPKEWVKRVAQREGIEDSIVHPVVAQSKEDLLASGKLERLLTYKVDEERYRARAVADAPTPVDGIGRGGAA